MTPRPRVVCGAALASAGLLLLMASGCSHYRIGIPLVPGLSLGLGATNEGNFSVGLNTGFGPLGAGVAVNNGGQVSGSAGAGVGIGPVSTGVGKGAVLYDPKAAPSGAVASATPAPVAAATATATAPARAPLVKITRPPPQPLAPAVNVTYRTPAPAVAPARDIGTPGNPVAP